ncbi:hypothetical protein ACA910_005484 [Epithemia clementina (nom. ined.)]
MPSVHTLHAEGGGSSSSAPNLYEHLSLGRIFSRTLNLFVDRLDVYMTLSAMVSVPTAIAMALVSAYLRLEQLEITRLTSDDAAMAATRGDVLALNLMAYFQVHHRVMIVAFTMQVILFLLIMVIGEGAVVRAAADTYAGQWQGWWACFKVGLQQFWRLLGVAAIVNLLTYGGLLVMFGFGVLSSVLFFFLSIAYFVGLAALVACLSLSNPAVVVENKGPMTAVRRSMELSEGRRFYVLCPLVLLWIVRTMVGILLHNIFNSSDNPLRYMTPTGILISLVPDLFYTPLHCIMKMVLYASIRVDKEGLTKTVLQRELVVAPVTFTDPSLTAPDYRQVSLMEDDSKDSIATGLVSDFA